MKKIVLFSAALLIGASTFAQTLIEKVEPAPGSIDISYEKWQLDNGLTIIVHEDHSDPIVHTEVTYHVGSNREQIGITGFAHFFEHMMFQGSDNVADEEHFKIISEAGGDMNGTTNRDRTNYFETVPSNQLETTLWLEADRMGFLIDAVTQKKFEVQRDAVKNEKAQRQTNVPYGMVMEILGQTLYPNGHPYSWPTIGYVDDLDRVTVTELKDFFKRWYGPNNAYLVVSGDVNTAEVVSLANKYFGPIPRGQEVRDLRTPRVNLPQNKYRKFADHIYFPLAMFDYPTVGNFHKDEAAIDALADIMGEGNNSPFYQTFVKTEKAVEASVFHYSQELAGEFIVQVVSYPEFTFAEVEEEVYKLLNNFEEHITDEALERFKSKMRSNIISGLSSVRGKSAQLSQWAYLLDESYNFSDELARYESITKADVLKVYHKYVKNKNAAIVDYYPLPWGAEDSIQSVNPNGHIPFKKDKQYEGLTYNKPTDDFDRSAQPLAGAVEPVSVPDFYVDNVAGISVMGTQTNEIPKVFILIELEGGDLLIADETKKAGLPMLSTMLLNEGTKNFTTEEISSKLDNLGSTISFNSSDRSSNIVVSSLVENLDATLEILEEKLLKPGFNAEDFKRIKKALKESINSNKKSGSNMAEAAFAQKLYGKSIRGIESSVKSVDKLKLSDVQSFYHKQFTPKAANIVVVGAISQEEVMPKLAFLNKWEGEELVINKNLPQEEISGRNIYLVHKPGPQSIIVMGHHGSKFDVDGEHFKTDVMNYAFGGAFNSRLNLNLREDKGYTYGIRSSFQGNDTDGVFYIQASVKGEATDSAMTEIFMEMENYLANGITEEELAFTKNSIANADALKYETIGQKAGFLSTIHEYDLDKNYRAKQKEILKAITIADVNALAKKNIHANDIVIVVVGNKYSLKDKLAQFGKVTEVKLK
ncbi:MAG: insulinase family protein [Bacteroidetes bacterium]|nr:insulinase family protein [Bacteroidota bacterium]